MNNPDAWVNQYTEEPLQLTVITSPFEREVEQIANHYIPLTVAKLEESEINVNVQTVTAPLFEADGLIPTLQKAFKMNAISDANLIIIHTTPRDLRMNYSAHMMREQLSMVEQIIRGQNDTAPIVITNWYAVDSISEAEQLRRNDWNSSADEAALAYNDVTVFNTTTVGTMPAGVLPEQVHYALADALFAHLTSIQ
ncbi:MAG: hypothetical protein ACRC5C_15370 [Bacilli bacterium]